MFHAPSEVIVAYIIKGKYGSHPDNNLEWPAFAGRQPDDPENIITITDTAPSLEGRIQKTGETINHPGIQVFVRSSDYLQGWHKISKLATLFDAVKRTEVRVENRRYRIEAATIESGPMTLGQDPTKRMLFTLNLILTIKEI